MSTSKRLEFLQKMTASGTDDPMAWYGLAMEYRNLERFDEALATFKTLREKRADYVAMYLMCGQMLEKQGDKAAAKEWMTAGVEAAKKKGDSHALGELQGALDALD
jgi:predicted Zn-dependent protease